MVVVLLLQAAVENMGGARGELVPSRMPLLHVGDLLIT
jgi:hypothetical protein